MSRADKRKAIQRLVESSGELSSNQIANALGVCNQTVDAVREQLGKSQAGKRKGADGKQYPAKMKREPRGDDSESDRDDEKTEPPPDPPDHRQACDRMVAFWILTAMGQRDAVSLERAVERYAGNLSPMVDIPTAPDILRAPPPVEIWCPGCPTGGERRAGKGRD